jgi:hypothetical protein
MSSNTGLPVSCQCGNIQFRTLSTAPLGIAHCHCTDCQKQSASAFGTSAYFPSADFFPLSPDLEKKLGVFTYTADSGNTKECYFCLECGVRIFHLSYYPDGTRREVVSIKAGCIDSGLDWSSAKHIFTRSAVFKIPEDREQYEAAPPGKIATDKA